MGETGGAKGWREMGEGRMTIETLPVNQELWDELYLPYQCIERIFRAEKRWGTLFDVVFEYDGKFWMIKAEFPATEMQEQVTPFDYGPETVNAVRVHKVPVTDYQWVPYG